MVSPTIMLAEDEPTLARAIIYTLEKEGYQTHWAANGGVALETFQREPLDLVLLDLMLPVMDGLEVCRAIRKSSVVPIMMVTARVTELDKVVGLELGADDYLTKPFGMRELLARVRALLRRADADRTPPERKIHVANLVIEPLKRRVERDGVQVALRPREFDLLLFLARNRGQVFTRDKLIERVWGYDFAGESRTVDVHIRMLREKLERTPSQPELIHTMRHVGYSFG